MKEIILPKILFYEKKSQEELSLCKIRDRWQAALFTSAALGVFSGLAGLIISGLSLLSFFKDSKEIGNAGACLIVAAFPLMMLTAHCLDKIYAADKAIRLDYCRRHGLKDKEC